MRHSRFSFGWRNSVLIAALIVAVLPQSTVSQQQSRTTQTVKRPAPRIPKASITISGGWAVPISRPMLRDYWKPGPTASIAAYFNVNRLVAFGLGAEGSYFLFDDSAFAGRYPSVTPHPVNTANIHLFVGWKYTGRLGTVLSPTFGATVGGSKMTNAWYQERVLGVRTTYYRVQGKTRLTVGVTAGLEFNFSPTFALALEGRAQYLHNDPAVGLLTSGRLGVRLNIFKSSTE